MQKWREHGNFYEASHGTVKLVLIEILKCFHNWSETVRYLSRTKYIYYWLKFQNKGLGSFKNIILRVFYGKQNQLKKGKMSGYQVLSTINLSHISFPTRCKTYTVINTQQSNGPAQANYFLFKGVIFFQRKIWSTWQWTGTQDMPNKVCYHLHWPLHICTHTRAHKYT